LQRPNLGHPSTARHPSEDFLRTSAAHPFLNGGAESPVLRAHHSCADRVGIVR